MFSDGAFAVLIVTYIALIFELIGRMPPDEVAPKERRIMYVRATVTLGVFGAAALVALKYPLIGLGLCIGCLIVYLKPEAPGATA